MQKKKVTAQVVLNGDVYTITVTIQMENGNSYLYSRDGFKTVEDALSVAAALDCEEY